MGTGSFFRAVMTVMLAVRVEVLEVLPAAEGLAFQAPVF